MNPTAEVYYRHVVYTNRHGRNLRPETSFASLRDAVIYLRDVEGEFDKFQIIDLEHIWLGDMLTAPDAAATIANIEATL